jgi:hypothetical protein
VFEDAVIGEYHLDIVADLEEGITKVPDIVDELGGRS